MAPLSLRSGVFVLAILALVMVWGGHARLSRDVLNAQTKETIAQAETMARAFEKSAHRTIHEVDIALRTIALNFAEGGVPQARLTIDEGLYDPGLIRHFAILDVAGDPIFRSGGVGAPAAARDDATVAVHRAAGQDLLNIGTPQGGPASGRPLLRFSRRLTANDGSFAGVVIAGIYPEYLSDLYRQMTLGRHGAAMLIGLDKVICARGPHPGPDTAETAIPHSKLWDALATAPSGVYWQEAQTDGILRAYAYREVEGYPLVVAAGVAMADIEAAVADLRRPMLLIAGLLTASIVLIAVVLLAQHRSAERLKAALSLNRDVLARVSHELRTPLNAILGFSEVIKEQMLGPDAGRRYADYAKDIHESGRHLLTLIDDILDLSHLQTGRTALKPEPVDTAAAVEWAIRIIAPQADAKSIRVDMSIHPGADRVTADERALKQMLLNLLSNAVKFTPEGGRILVAVARGPGGRHHIRVADTGIGMTPEQLRQAFVPFGQTSAMATHSGQGTGLGLSIVKALVEAHGGRLSIDSDPGKGSRVTLEFAA